MGRTSWTLMLATSTLLAASALAFGQSSSTDPLPDPSAVLLPPVVSLTSAPLQGTTVSDLPSPSDQTPGPEAKRASRTIWPQLTGEEMTPKPVDEPVRPIAPVRRTRDEENDFRAVRPRSGPGSFAAASGLSGPGAMLRAPSESTALRAVDYEESRREPAEADGRRSTGPGRSRSAEDQEAYEYLFRRRGRGLDDDVLRYDEDSFRSPRRSQQIGDRFNESIEDILGGGRRGGGLIRDRELFRSDHRFDSFISPTTNPFYFEDPRTLSEVRPIFIYQSIPKNHSSAFNGGSTWFIGGQARLAFTDRISLVVNKIGLSGFSPGSGSTQSSNTGLSELWLGPKFALVQNAESKTLLSAGATFQIPLGSSSVYQNTGKLAIVPYVSGAQELFNSDWGSFNGMASAGYSLSTNRDRSDFFYVGAHLDWNFRNNCRFYPFLEANWFSYTVSGQSTDLGVEGRDLANFGGVRSAGSNIVTGAIGSRYKISKSWDVGAAFEFPLFGSRDLFRYRLSLDLIWRY